MVDSVAMRIPIPAIVIPAAVVLTYLFVPGLRERPWTLLRIAGAVLSAAAFVLAIVARLQLGKSFSVRPQAWELVTWGLYSRLRHPIYVFVDLMFIGLILLLEVYWLFAIVPLVLLVQFVQARREGRVLREAFGQAYIEYRNRTWF